VSYSKDSDLDYPANYTGPVKFIHDPQILLPSSSYLTEEQIFSFFSSIECPTLLITGENGWPLDQFQLEQRAATLKQKVSPNISHNYYFARSKLYLLL